MPWRVNRNREHDAIKFKFKFHLIQAGLDQAFMRTIAKYRHGQFAMPFQDANAVLFWSRSQKRDISII